MYRTAATRLAASRSTALRQSPRSAVSRELAAHRQTARRYATEPQAPAAGSSHTLIILAALAGLGAGGYYFLKPVRDVASLTHSAISTAKDGAGGLSDSAGGLAKMMLGPSALAMYQSLASQPGGINGFLSSLKDKDLQGVMDEVKKVGGDDVKRIMEKVEGKVKEAKGKVEHVDWKGLAQELKTELPKDKQHMVDMLIGKIPDKADIDQYISKAKEMGGDQLKQVEQAASKILAKVEQAKKEGKGSADAFLKGLKEATPADIDDLIKQLKEAAKKAGLPADQAEAWLKSKADDGKIDPEAISKQLEDRLKQAARFMPSDPQDLVKQVEQFSPSVAKLLQQAMEQSGVLKASK